jgi:beta-xylosidase
MTLQTNKPVIPMDFPDPDVIRVSDVFYMITTTMHFFPGGEILRSYDLVHWEHAAFVFDHLDTPPTKRQLLEDGENIYGNGMWAGSLRYHNGTFYILFAANDTHRSYLYTASDISGPWQLHDIEGFYYDCSLFFDDDDRVYIVHGNTDVHLTEMEPDLSKPKSGGVERVILSDDKAQVDLGYEGSHLYKINNRYFLITIHWPKKSPNRRTEACFVTDDIHTGVFRGKDVFNDDMGFKNQGVAQGSIVDDTAGAWYAVLFQDRGALGRMPVLLPIHFDESGFPVFGVNGLVPQSFNTVDNRPDHEYKPLVSSDDFNWSTDPAGKPLIPTHWEWNHLPDNDAWTIAKDAHTSNLILKNNHLAPNVIFAKNTLTQRTVFPRCSFEVTLDASQLHEGDHAGLVSLLSGYASIGVTKRSGDLLLEFSRRIPQDTSLNGMPEDHEPVQPAITRPLPGKSAQLKIDYSSGESDTSSYWMRFSPDDEWIHLADHNLVWKMDHFTGCRIGLFSFATKNTGGLAKFSDFIYADSVD